MNLLENEEAEQHYRKDIIDDNNLLIRHLLKLSKQIVSDLKRKNENIEKKLDECNFNTTNLIINGNLHETRVQNDLRVSLLVSCTVYLVDYYFASFF